MTATSDSFFNAKGPVPYGLMNDYMFKVTLGKSPLALKGLICSLLHLSSEEVISVDVMNPTEPGDSVDSKDMIFDLKVNLNNNTFINLEMQVTKQAFWPERSLTYLCRAFNHLKEGESYSKIKPAIHIGFIDFDLCPEEPEFYSTYHLANDVTHRIYTSKFTLSVVNLKRIELATDADRKYGIDYWAALFKSTTWEEIQMLAKKNTAIAEAAQTMYRLSEDDLVRERCASRQEHYRILQTYEDEAKKNKETIQALASENALLIHLITSKLKAGKSLEQIAVEVEMPVDDIRPLYEHIKQDLS